VVTRTFPEFGYFYVEELDGAMGIRVASVASPDPGDIITIASGTMATYRGQRYLSNASYTISEHNRATKPVGMPNKAVGGGDFLYEPGPPIVGQRGMWDGSGLNNVGKLIRVWGKVVDIYYRDDNPASGVDYYYIDDGSNVDLAVDLEVAPGQWILKSCTDIELGTYVAVTGISSCLDIDSWLIRVLRPSAPTVKIAKAVGQSDPATKFPIKATATFSEPVTGFTNAGISHGIWPPNSTVVATDSGDHKVYNLEITLPVTHKTTIEFGVAGGAASSTYYGELSLATLTSFSINYSPYLPFRTINAREGVAAPGRHPKKPLR
ncbi:MAG: hypothetical protein WC554_16735, partial [Clostridia bacterium]